MAGRHVTITCRIPWHSPMATALAVWRRGGWRVRLVRVACPALAAALDATYAALPPAQE